MEEGMEGRGWSLPAVERWLRMERRRQMRETLRVQKDRMHPGAGRGLEGEREKQGAPTILANPDLHEQATLNSSLADESMEGWQHALSNQGPIPDFS